VAPCHPDLQGSVYYLLGRPREEGNGTPHTVAPLNQVTSADPLSYIQKCVFLGERKRRREIWERECSCSRPPPETAVSCKPPEGWDWILVLPTACLTQM
jgi:hypothetical protein